MCLEFNDKCWLNGHGKWTWLWSCKQFKLYWHDQWRNISVSSPNKNSHVCDYHLVLTTLELYHAIICLQFCTLMLSYKFRLPSRRRRLLFADVKQIQKQGNFHLSNHIIVGFKSINAGFLSGCSELDFFPSFVFTEDLI